MKKHNSTEPTPHHITSIDLTRAIDSGLYTGVQLRLLQELRTLINLNLEQSARLNTLATTVISLPNNPPSNPAFIL